MWCLWKYAKSIVFYQDAAGPWGNALHERNPPDIIGFMAGFDAVARQAAVFLSRVRGIPKRVPVNPERLERAARARMSARAYAYVAGGAGREDTVGENRRAFDRIRIVPEVLHDVGNRRLSVRLFGREIPAPVFLAPIGVLELAHPLGDLAVAAAAGELGIPAVFSSQASSPMEDCASILGSSPRWFQLYFSKSDELVRSFVSRAASAGCDAIVVTLDTTLLGWRPRDLDLRYLPFLYGRGIAQYTSDPVFLEMLRAAGDMQAPGPAEAGTGSPPERGAGRAKINATSLSILFSNARRFPGGRFSNLLSAAPRRAVETFINIYSRPSITWADLAFLRSVTNLPIVLKGILSPADAERAIDSGADAVYVSNHGGRQIDGEIAALDALGPVAARVKGRIPVLFDGGVRTGADVFKALALGATAVGIGRPYVYGLAIAGAAGAREVVENVVAELELTMALAGCAETGSIDRTRLARYGRQDPTDPPATAEG